MPNYDSYPRVTGTDPGSASVANGGISSTSASGGPYVAQTWNYYIAAGAGGSADDVTLQNANLPMKAFIVDVHFLPIAVVAMSTVTLRDAAAGAGNAYSSALASAVAATNARTTLTRATAAAANSSLFLRRTDSAVSGVLTITYIPTV